MAVNSSLDMNVSFIACKRFTFAPFHGIKLNELSACGRAQGVFSGVVLTLFVMQSGGPGPYLAKCCTN